MSILSTLVRRVSKCSPSPFQVFCLKSFIHSFVPYFFRSFVRQYVSMHSSVIFLLTSLLDRHLQKIFLLNGLTNSPYIGGVELRKTPQSTFCMNVKFWFHSDLHIWDPFSWTQGIFQESNSVGNTNVSKGSGLRWLGIRLWGTKGV